MGNSRLGSQWLVAALLSAGTVPSSQAIIPDTTPPTAPPNLTATVVPRTTYCAM
jgi:hypothetical protein